MWKPSTWPSINFEAAPVMGQTVCVAVESKVCGVYGFPVPDADTSEHGHSTA